jgi:nitrile hydratase accessory protein
LNEQAEDTVRFDEPWQAYAWAMARDLCASGLFSPAEWSERLGTARLTAGDDNNAYYSAVLDALESLIVEKGAVARTDLAHVKERWHHAYETTPHGKPVVLGDR